MTAQIGDILILDGEKQRMAFTPPLPVGTLFVIRTPDDELTSECTACWRGYIATWEIEDGRFYLKALDGFASATPAWRMGTAERIPADWFTGVLRLPRGEMLHYVHMGFGSVFEREEHIKIEAGAVLARRMVDNRRKDHDALKLGFANLPGGENHFDGDDW